jgi:hypothetical protein
VVVQVRLQQAAPPLRQRLRLRVHALCRSSAAAGASFVRAKLPCTPAGRRIKACSAAWARQSMLLKGGVMCGVPAHYGLLLGRRQVARVRLRMRAPA